MTGGFTQTGEIGSDRDPGINSGGLCPTRCPRCMEIVGFREFVRTFGVRSFDARLGCVLDVKVSMAQHSLDRTRDSDRGCTPREYVREPRGSTLKR